MGTDRALKYYSVVRVQLKGDWIAFKRVVCMTSDYTMALPCRAADSV